MLTTRAAISDRLKWVCLQNRGQYGIVLCEPRPPLSRPIRQVAVLHEQYCVNHEQCFYKSGNTSKGMKVAGWLLRQSKWIRHGQHVPEIKRKKKKKRKTSTGNETKVCNAMPWKWSTKQTEKAEKRERKRNRKREKEFTRKCIETKKPSVSQNALK